MSVVSTVADKTYRSRAPGELPLDRQLTVLADRVGWEEKRLLAAAAETGVDAGWVDDGCLCIGSSDFLSNPNPVILVRSKSFVRGPLLTRMLEAAGARVVNGATAATVCADKSLTLRLLADAGVPIVPFRLVFTRADLDLAVERLGLPLVLKPLTGGFGRCVMLGRDRDLIHAVYDFVEQHARGFERALIGQPLIDGEDVRVIVSRGEAIAAISRRPTEDWRANVAAGAAAMPLEIDERLRSLAAEVSDLLGLDFAGIDLFHTGSGYLVSEVNHVPEFRAVSEATGIEIAPAVISAAMERA